VVELARLAGWSPVPLSVRDARRHATGLRHDLAPQVRDTAPQVGDGADENAATAAGTTRPVAVADDLRLRYGAVTALRGVSLTLHRGEIVALMGRNGAGKSSLLGCLAGLTRPATGRLSVAGLDPRRADTAHLVRAVGLVPQQPGDLLYATSVAEECRTADSDGGRPIGTTQAVLDGLAPDIPGDRHPRDLSEGQRLMLALAIVLAGEPRLVLLDEPTRGLDYQAKHRLVGVLRRLASAGHSIVLATHDVELVAECSHRVAILADGELVADGPAAGVLASSPAFAPQVAKVMAPQPWLTVGDVARAMGRAG
jgi:energy-coupling factor transport system ATP-binding protein